MNTRTPLIAGNWKMYKTNAEAVETAGHLVELVADTSDVDIMIAPVFTAIDPVSKVVTGSRVGLGAQNLYWEKEGAYTGEISADMLISAGCQYVIIGHSERRQYFGETDETVNKKISAAIAANLIPVFCIGETEAERESGNTFSVLDKQVKDGLKDKVVEDLGSLVIAYEPVWAIGTGKTATSDQAQEAHKYIRSLIDGLFGTALADAVRILYGGSVKPANVAELMGMPDIDGALVGGASLEAESFSQIVKFK
ncbi:Triosephosphate isomerase (EC [Olavius algarvensis Delta 1 endosymbiont]|nr:Triosephosphate isomerase (EC [Olavius algarvensis Delta 1 endosymbiont]